MLLFLLDGMLLLRFADRRLFALLFQLPPRFTRFEPDGRRHSIMCYRLWFHEAFLHGKYPVAPEKTVHLLRGIVIGLHRNDEEFKLHCSP